MYNSKIKETRHQKSIDNLDSNQTSGSGIIIKSYQAGLEISIFYLPNSDLIDGIRTPSEIAFFTTFRTILNFLSMTIHTILIRLYLLLTSKKLNLLESSYWKYKNHSPNCCNNNQICECPTSKPPPPPSVALVTDESPIDESDSKQNYVLISKSKMNLVILSTFFCLGVLSALFLLVLIKYDGSSPAKKLYQPMLPQAEQLLIGNYESSYGPSTDTDSWVESVETESCDGENALGLELEAISSVHAALEMKEHGKTAKALKLFQHAFSLCPRHPDVLTHYGEFHEDSDDYIMADHLYLSALTYSPRHSKALVNRQRTLPLVNELDTKKLQVIDSKRDLLLQVDPDSPSIHRIKKEAYFQYLHHTVGIEGNTMTLSQTRMIIETRLAVGGKSIQEHNEILGMDSAMKYINETFSNIDTLSIEEILRIHYHIMSYVDPTEAGKFRRTQVFVGKHVPPPPADIDKHMNQLVEWLNSEDTQNLHPIQLGAILHYKLVWIHPFVDGNGRSSRLLMNWILMKHGYPPVIIPKQDRHLYYEYLDTANNGDIRPFIRFIGKCTEKTLDAYLWATSEQVQSIIGPTETKIEN